MKEPGNGNTLMVADIDIWRTATLLLKQRDDPEFFAAQRADELLGAGESKVAKCGRG